MTIGNVKDPNRLYANAIVAWMIFGRSLDLTSRCLPANITGFVLYTVARECVYYVNMRQAYLSSPYYSQRLSQRTVLFTSVPPRYQDEARLRKLYGDSVKRVWLPRTHKQLANLVKEREQTALRLEKAEIELIKKANHIRYKQLRKVKKQEKAEADHQTGSQSDLAAAEEGNAHGSQHSGNAETASTRSQSTRSQDDSTLRRESDPITETSDKQDSAVAPTPDLEKEKREDGAFQTEDDIYKHPYGVNRNISDVRGSVAALYLKAESRPYHRPIGNYGRRIDTIRWTRRRLIELNADIAKLRKRLRSPNCTADKLPVAFVEFDTQEAAQAAHQVVTHHQALHMAPRFLGIRPDEVVWSALRMRWWERIIRRFGILGFIVAAIIFFSIPSAIVGVISNVQVISDMIPFLKWLVDLPKPILGFLTGFVPAAALSLFMAVVPILLRGTFLPCPSLAYVCLTYTCRRMRQNCWGALPQHGRALYTDGLLRLPGRPGLPRDDPHLGGLDGLP